MTGAAVESWTPEPGLLCLCAPIVAITGPAAASEQALFAAMAPGRQRQSAAVRALARQALQQLGGPLAAIGRGAVGEPLFPAGWVGSLSHTAAHCAALVAAARPGLYLGVDLEEGGALPEDAATLVLNRAEAEMLRQLPGGYPRWSRAVFAAKECVHKCVHPATGTFLEFDEVTVRLDAAAGRFEARPRSSAARAALDGVVQGYLRADAAGGACVLAALVLRRR